MERKETVCYPHIEDDCLQGMGTDGTTGESESWTRMTEEQAQQALQDYEELHDTIREFEEEKQWVVQKLTAWLEQQGAQKVRLNGRECTRTLAMTKTRRRSTGTTRALRVS